LEIEPRFPSVTDWDSMRNLRIFVAAPFLSVGVITAALADGPDISAQRLIASWHDDDPGMKMVAEVIASAFASGFSWGGDAAGKKTYCAPADLKGAQVMTAFEAFVKESPALADQPYGVAMSATLAQAFPCARGA
jgi:hypothetical protein